MKGKRSFRTAGVLVIICASVLLAGSLLAQSSDAVKQTEPTSVQEAARSVFVNGGESHGSGYRGRVTDEFIEVQTRAAALSDAGPQSLVCSEDTGAYTCSPIADEHVIEALKQGKTIYQRTVHAAISEAAVEQRTPIFSSGELLCGEFTDGVASCESVAIAKTHASQGTREIATYLRLSVSFSEGFPLVSIPAATVPLRYAPN